MNATAAPVNLTANVMMSGNMNFLAAPSLFRRPPRSVLIENQTTVETSAEETRPPSDSVTRHLILLRHAKSSWQYPSLRESSVPKKSNSSSSQKLLLFAGLCKRLKKDLKKWNKVHNGVNKGR
ncbi:hypothetical protein RJ639_014637 [Escallonia herrerae]|uniref:Uncharacterized protein n=1 Tax=Escallonia herrerae TaxID=1293975 RepID=A0AA88VIT6_9ASTE|nr:hypothetical protein RJ639_014637 [Escallonia herrerae]